MGGVRGDFGELQRLSFAFGGLGSIEFRLGLATNLAEESRTQVIFGFRNSVDPYGNPWKPLRSRDGQPLRDSGRLQNSVSARPHVTERGFTISTGVKYAAVHQYGATIRAKNATITIGGAGSDGQDMVTFGKPMLRFRVGGARPRTKGRWVAKAQVTVPRRQFIPEGDVGPRWGGALDSAAEAYVNRKVGGG